MKKTMQRIGIPGLLFAGVILLCAGFEAGKASVDWGRPEWKGGYVTMPATETNLTLQIGMRDDGVVVWRKVR